MRIHVVVQYIHKMTQQVIDSMNFHDRRAKGIYAKFEKVMVQDNFHSTWIASL